MGISRTRAFNYSIPTLLSRVRGKQHLAMLLYLKSGQTKHIERDTFIGLSEIDAGSGVFEKSKRERTSHTGGIKATSDSQSDQDFSQVFENEKGQRVSRLFELLKLQDENDCEIVIAAGAETETKRIHEIINEESSLARLKPQIYSNWLK